MGSSRPEILGAYLTERLSVYDCPESCGADFSGPCGVAQSARVGAGGLLVHGGLPENGNLRLGATNATSSSLGSGQHRRRISSAWESGQRDRKSTRLNSSHLGISYAVFCLKKKKSTNGTGPPRQPNLSRTRCRRP